MYMHRSYSAGALRYEAALPLDTEPTWRRAAWTFLHSGGEHCPDVLACPISHALMLDPVSTQNGQTYERENITAWWASPLGKTGGAFVDPLTNGTLSSGELRDNLSARSRVAAFREAVLALDPGATRYFVTGGEASLHAARSRPSPPTVRISAAEMPQDDSSSTTSSEVFAHTPHRLRHSMRATAFDPPLAPPTAAALRRPASQAANLGWWRGLLNWVGLAGARPQRPARLSRNASGRSLVSEYNGQPRPLRAPFEHTRGEGLVPTLRGLNIGGF